LMKKPYHAGNLLLNDFCLKRVRRLSEIIRFGFFKNTRGD
jgi:hypothetical protein